MMNQPMQPSNNPAEIRETRSIFVAKTYLWMFLGLLTTFVVSIAAIGSGLFYYILATPVIFYALLIAEVALVFILAGRLQKMSTGVAKWMFFLYAVVNGVTLSSIFFLYELESVALIFAGAAVIFGIMSLFGYVTKNDLSGVGKVAIFGILGLAVFWLLSLVLNLSRFEMIISFIGLALFLAITAYDTQKIKKLYTVYQYDEVMLQKASIYSALQLYLDFINVFLYLLRLLGKRR